MIVHRVASILLNLLSFKKLNIRRSIEVVITGLTRNQFAGNRTWVRIPPAAPNVKLSVHDRELYYFTQRCETYDQEGSESSGFTARSSAPASTKPARFQSPCCTSPGTGGSTAAGRWNPPRQRGYGTARPAAASTGSAARGPPGRRKTAG